MAEEALKDQSGYCRKEHKKMQKTGKAGNEPGQSQDGSPFLSSFRLLRQTLFPLVGGVGQRLHGFRAPFFAAWRLGGFSNFGSQHGQTDEAKPRSRKATKGGRLQEGRREGKTGPGATRELCLLRHLRRSWVKRRRIKAGIAARNARRRKRPEMPATKQARARTVPPF